MPWKQIQQIFSPVVLKNGDLPSLKLTAILPLKKTQKEMIPIIDFQVRTVC